MLTFLTLAKHAIYFIRAAAVANHLREKLWGLAPVWHKTTKLLSVCLERDPVLDAGFMMCDLQPAAVSFLPHTMSTDGRKS